MSTRGIDIGDTDFLLHAQPMSGRSYVLENNKLVLKKQFHSIVQPYVYQMSKQVYIEFIMIKIHFIIIIINCL